MLPSAFITNEIDVDVHIDFEVEATPEICKLMTSEGGCDWVPEWWYNEMAGRLSAGVAVILKIAPLPIGRLS